MTKLRAVLSSMLYIIKPQPGVATSEAGARKILFSLAALMSLGGLVWGTICVYFKLYYASLIPYGYIFISILNISIISTRSLSLARSVQIFASMLLPFGLQWMLGGYFASGIVMLWSTLALVGSVTLLRGRFVYRWLILFVVLAVVSAWLEPTLIQLKPQIISDQASLLMLIVNLLMISSIVFVLSKLKSDSDQEINNKLENVNAELESNKANLEQIVQERTQQLEKNLGLMEGIQAEMKTAMAQAQKANEAKSQFLANMSHEIRSPLNAILGLSQIMALRAPEVNLSDEFKQYIGNVKLSGENLLELINNILDLSKIEAGKIEMSFETVNVKQLFKGIYQINKTRADEKDIHFTYEIDAALPDLIETDRTKLNQILMNLVTNAIKFTPSGKTVHIKAFVDGKHLVFTVNDTGVGIAPERLEQIFEPFEQADNSITRKFGGTGLGLTITKKMTELLKGEVFVQSKWRVGTMFTVRLPLIEGISTDFSRPAQIIGQVKFAKPYTILIVEDNNLNQQIIITFLKTLGLQWLVADNGKIGVEKVVNTKPDLVIMDIHMPVMDGHQAIQLIRAMPEFKSLPIVCLTADAFTDQEKKAMALGANDYLTKPIDLEKLVRILSKYFETLEN